MGEMADYYREQELFDDLPLQLTRNSIWHTKNGQRIAVKDLQDAHLLNIIRCLRGMSPHGTKIGTRQPTQRRQWLNALANEAYARGLSLDSLTDKEPAHE